MSSLLLNWNDDALRQQLRPLLPGLSVEIVPQLGSTNSALLERARVSSAAAVESDIALVHRSAESAAFGRRSADVEPCLLVAEQQVSGRGRMGRSWQSAAGASLTFSLALPLAPADWSGLSLAVGVALAEALDPGPAAASSLRLGVKWPNDLWLMAPHGTGRKLAGILIETVSAGHRRLAVIGVGINVLPLPDHTLGGTDPTPGLACVQELPSPDGAAPTAPQVLEHVALPLVQALLQFEREGFAGFAARFAARDVLQGRSIRTTQPGLTEGVARGVAANGALRVETPDGVVHDVVGGEVSVRMPPGAAC